MFRIRPAPILCFSHHAADGTVHLCDPAGGCARRGTCPHPADAAPLSQLVICSGPGYQPSLFPVTQGSGQGRWKVALFDRLSLRNSRLSVLIEPGTCSTPGAWHLELSRCTHPGSRAGRYGFAREAAEL